MTVFVNSGNDFDVRSSFNMKTYEHLPLGTYVIRHRSDGTIYLEKTENISIPSKIYGDANKNLARIINTFMDRNGSTGILLSGEKGSGKTLLSKLLSHKLLNDYQIPTIIVNTPYTGDSFNFIINSIKQPCMFLFDEFEKVYSEEQQEALLGMLDGAFTSKKLFVMTCNDKYKMSRYMHNRPGRFFYSISYKGVDSNFIREYCEDRLNDKDKIESVLKISTMFDSFNFDILQSLVEEMNRYNENAFEAIALLNAKPEYGARIPFKGKVFFKGTNKEASYGDANVTIHPLKCEFSFNVFTSPEEVEKYENYITTDDNSDEPEYDMEYVEFTTQTITSIHDGIYKFESKCGKYIAVLERVEEPQYDLKRLM